MVALWGSVTVRLLRRLSVPILLLLWWWRVTIRLLLWSTVVGILARLNGVLVLVSLPVILGRSIGVEWLVRHFNSYRLLFKERFIL